MGACSEPGRTKRDKIGVIIPPSSCAWRLRTGSFRTPPLINKIACSPFSLVSCMLCVIVPVIKMLVPRIFSTPILYCPLTLYPTPFFWRSWNSYLYSHSCDPIKYPTSHPTQRLLCSFSLISLRHEGMSGLFSVPTATGKQSASI